MNVILSKSASQKIHNSCSDLCSDTMTKRNAATRFATGAPCYLKKGNCAAVTLGAEGRLKWKVERVNDAGEKTGVQLVVTSCQLQNPTDDDDHLLPREKPDSRKEKRDDEATSIKATSSSIEVAIDQDSSTRDKFESDGDGQDDDPDLNMFEDLQTNHDNDLANNNDNAEQEGITEPFALGQDVEQNDDKFKARWEAHSLEKQCMLKDGFAVKCNPSRGQKIDVGTRVMERRAPKRISLIVGDCRIDPNDSPSWTIQWEKTQEQSDGIPSTGIKIIRDDRVFKWKVRDESYPENPVQPFNEHGVVGFKFTGFDEAKLKLKQTDDEKLRIKKDRTEHHYPFLRLLQHLWPGDWRAQLRNLNVHIDTQNAKANSKKRISLVSESKWWVWWGIAIAAGPIGKGGCGLFEPATLWRLVPTVNFGPEKGGLNVMTKNCFTNIRDYTPFSFCDHQAKDDPWHPIKLLVDGYNDNRKRKLAAAITLALDESMSSF